MSTYHLKFAGPAPEETRRNVLEQLRNDRGRRIFQVLSDDESTVTIRTLQEETAEQQRRRLAAWAECKRVFAESPFWRSLSIALLDDSAAHGQPPTEQLELFEVAS